MSGSMVSRDNRLCTSELFSVSSDCLIIAVICHYVALRRRQIRTPSRRVPRHTWTAGQAKSRGAISNEINVNVASSSVRDFFVDCRNIARKICMRVVVYPVAPRNFQTSRVAP
jgi:hypothetical protein